MYIDHSQIETYEQAIQRLAREYQDAQYDAAFVKQGLGKISAWLGQRLLSWGQRLQANSPITHMHSYLRS